MKFLALACALTSTAHANSFKTCGNVTHTVYTDSDCQTIDKTNTEIFKDENFAISCAKDTESSEWIKYQCNTEFLERQVFPASDECKGNPSSENIVWGQCTYLEGLKDGKIDLKRWQTFKAGYYMSTAIIAGALAFSATQY